MLSGHREDELGGHDQVLAERAVVRRCGEEPHVGTQVVAACQALSAVPTGNPGFDRDPLPGLQPGNVASHLDDDAACLVAKDERGVDHVGADAAVFVVVHVGSADPDRADLDQHLVPTGSRDRALLDADVSGLAQHADPHRRHGHHAPINSQMSTFGITCSDASLSVLRRTVSRLALI